MKNKSFTVQIKSDALLSFSINAPSLEEALIKAKENLKDISLYSDEVECIDADNQITGVYE